MKKNDFEDFARTSAGRRAATLLLTHVVKPDEIFATVLAQLTEILPILEEHGRYTTEDLCGPDLWANWFTAERRVAGMCVAYLAKKPDVALYKHITPSGKGKAKYRNTPPPEPLRPLIRIVRSRRTGSVRSASAGSMA
jgi:hypothetical protein